MDHFTIVWNAGRNMCVVYTVPTFGYVLYEDGECVSTSMGIWNRHVFLRRLRKVVGPHAFKQFRREIYRNVK